MTDIVPANPFLVCDRCKARVTKFTNTGDGEGGIRNFPCGHAAGAESRCPSWSPVDGCNCVSLIGYRPHD